MEEGSPVDVQLREEQAALDSQSDILNELRSNMAEPSRRGRVKGSKQRREKQRPDIINTGAPPPLPGASPRVTSPEDMAGVREKAGAGFLFDDRVQRYYAATYQSNMSNVRLSPEQKKTLRQIPIDKWSELDIWEQIGPEGQAYVRNYKKNVAQMRTDYLESRGTPDAMRKEGIEFVRATDPETGMPKIYRGSKQKPFTQEFLERIKDDPNLKHYRKGGYFSLGGWVAKMLGFGEEALPKAGSKSHIKHKRNDLGFSINTTKSRAEQKQIIAIKRNSRGNRDMKEIATRESGVKNFAKGKQPWDINPDTKEYYADEMLPKTEEGMKRLYRTVDEEAFLSGAMGSGRQHSNTDSVLLEGAQEAAGKWFSDDINSMAFYSNQLLKEGKTPRLTYVDIPIEEAGKYNVKAQLPRELPEGFPVNPRLEGGHEAVSKIMKEEGLTHDEAMRTAIHRYQDAQENLANNPKWFSGGASSPEGLTGEYFLQNTEHVMGPGGRMMTRYTDPSKYLDDVKAFKRGGLVSYLRFGGDGTRTMFDMINTYISSRTARTVDHKLVEKSRRDVNRAINRQRHIDGSRSTEGTALPGQRTGAEQHAANVQAAVVDAAKSGDQDAVRFFESESERAKKILNKRTYERDMYEGSGRHARKEVSARAAVGEASASKAAMSDIVRSKATVPKEPSFVMGPDGKIHQLPIVKKPDLITNVTDVRTGEGIKVRQGPDPMKVMSGAPETPRGTGVDDFELQPRPEELDPDSSQIVPGLSGSNVLPQGGGPLPAGSGPQGALPSDSSTPPFTSASAATELHIPNLSRLSDPVDVPNAKLDFTIDDQLKNANRPNRRVEEGSVYTLDSAAKADAAMTEAQKRLGTQFFKGKTNAQLQEELGILRANINSAEMQRAVESGEEALRQLGIEPLPYRGNRAQMDYKAIEAMNAGRKTPPPAFIAGGAGPEVSDRLAEGKAPPSGQDIMNMNLDLKSGDLTPEQLKKIQEDNKRKMNRKRLGGMISYLQFGGGLKDKRVMPLPSVTPTQKNIRIASPNLNDNPAKHIQDMMEVIYGRSRSGTDDKTGRAKAFPGGRRKRELAKEAWMSDRKGNLEKYDMDFNIAEELFPSFYAKQPWLDTKQAEQDYLDFFDKFESEEARKFFLDSNNFPEMFTGGHLRYDKSFHRGGRYEPRKDRISLPAAEIEEMGLFERSPYNPNQLNVSRLGQGILHEGQQHRAIYEMLFREGRKAAGIPSLDSEYPRVSHTPGITNALQFGKGELTTGLTFPEPERQGFLKMLKERSPDIYKAYAGYRRNTGVKEKWKEDRGKPGTGERKDFWEIFGKDKGTNFQKYATGGDELLARLRTIADWNAMNDRNVLEALGKLEKGASNEEILDVYRNTPRMNSSLGLDKDGNPSIRQSWKNIQKYRNALHKNYDRDNRQITDMGMHRSTLEAMLSGKDEKKHLAELLILARKSGGPITRLEQGGGTGMGSAGASISTGGPVSHGTGVPAGELARSTDTRLTALTPGEFVVNKAMTDRHRGLLEQINSGQYARDGGIIYRRMGTPAFSGISQPTPQLNNWQNIFSALKPEINQGPQGQPIDFTKLTDGANTIKDAFDSFTDTLVGLDFAGQIKEAMSGNDIFKAFSDAIKGESALTKSLNDFTEKFGSGQTIKHEMTIPGIKNGMKLDPQEMEKFKADVITAVVSVLEGNQPESPVNKPAGDVT
jgi:3'-phosphoadenosine 5'-phosphosulfate sulfotransferase (PAPS reductase)/FAD synthetase